MHNADKKKLSYTTDDEKNEEKNGEVYKNEIVYTVYIADSNVKREPDLEKQ